MELKKCDRCGSFYTSDTQVCQNCISKDKQEIAKLQGYINDNGTNTTKQQISVDTGISTKNLDRYLNSEEFSGIIINDIVNSEPVANYQSEANFIQ